MVDREPGPGVVGGRLTRLELLRRGAGVGAVVVGGTAFAALAEAGCAGGGAPGAASTAAATSTEAPVTPASAAAVQRFVSRPDLRPATVTVVQRSAEAADGHLFLAPSSGPGQRGVMILDAAGELVWFHPTSPKTAMCFRAGLYRGRPALSWWEGRHVKGVGRVGQYMLVDDSYRQIARFSAGHGLPPDFHELLLTARSTALVTAYAPRAASLSAVGGPRRGRVYDGVVQELAIPSARVLFEWRSLDHVGIAESYQRQIGNPYDYFHVNAVDVDHDGNLLVSARNTWAVYKVDGRTGRVLWRLGGRRSNFAMGPGTRFAFQHDARSHERGTRISLFDNGPRPGATPRSRAILLAIDERRRRARLARQYLHRPPLFARVTGNAQLLPNGDYLVCWGSTGWFSEVAPDGAVRLDAHLPKGGQNYRVFRLPWRGRPRQPPTLAAARDRLYASWNGATEVRSWQVLAGDRADGLRATATVARGGFETELARPPGARYVAAAALDAAGRELGRTTTLGL